MIKWILIFCILASRMPGERERSIRYVQELVRPGEEREWRKVGWVDKEFELARFQDIKFEINFARKEEDKFKTCKEYGQDSGCLFVVLAKKGLVKFAMARFAKEYQTKKIAFAMKEYTFDRWVFEGVAGEPTLEDFVKEVFHAKKVERFP